MGSVPGEFKETLRPSMGSGKISQSRQSGGGEGRFLNGFGA